MVNSAKNYALIFVVELPTYSCTLYIGKGRGRGEGKGEGRGRGGKEREEKKERRRAKIVPVS